MPTLDLLEYNIEDIIPERKATIWSSCGFERMIWRNFPVKHFVETNVKASYNAGLFVEPTCQWACFICVASQTADEPTQLLISGYSFVSVAKYESFTSCLKLKWNIPETCLTFVPTINIKHQSISIPYFYQQPSNDLGMIWGGTPAFFKASASGLRRSCKRGYNEEPAFSLHNVHTVDGSEIRLTSWGW